MLVYQRVSSQPVPDRSPPSSSCSFQSPLQFPHHLRRSLPMTMVSAHGANTKPGRWMFACECFPCQCMFFRICWSDPWIAIQNDLKTDQESFKNHFEWLFQYQFIQYPNGNHLKRFFLFNLSRSDPPGMCSSHLGCKNWSFSAFLSVVVTYGYGSIPINTMFSGMNIHLPAILVVNNDWYPLVI